MLAKQLFYALFPRRCFICQSEIHIDSTLCAECHSVKRLSDYCHHCCNHTVPDVGCVHWQVSPRQENCVDRFIIGYSYEKAVREAIVQLKYHHRMYMVRVIKELIQPVIAEHREYLDDIDYIVPMPVDRVRLAGRGFNHMLEIANVLQPLMNKPILYEVLQKKSFTIPQSGLSRRERLKNLRSSFICQTITGNILLLDDVLTTGKTLHYGSQALKNSGANKISVLVVAKA